MISDKFQTLLNCYPQLFAIITATFGSISDGMQYGWQSPSVPKLQEPDSPIQMTESDLVWLDSMYFIGGLLALPLTSYSADKLGRKRTVQISSSIFCIAWIFVAFSEDVITLYAARFLAGFGSDTCYTATPLYIAEVADKKIRGFLGCFVYINFMIGVVIIYSVGPFMSIQNTAFVGLAVPVIQLITFSFMPESPYYRLVKNDEKSAEKSLKFLRRRDDVQEELAEIKAAVVRQESERGKAKDLLIVESNRRGVIIMMVLYGSQNFSAMTILFMNLHTILADAKGILDVSTAAIVFSIVMFIAAVLGSSLLEKLGRKKLLNISCTITGSALGLISLYFWMKAYNVDLHLLTWLPAAAVILYAAGFMSGLGLIPVILSSELFPTTVKAIGITVSDSGYLAFGIISMYFHRFVSEVYGLHIAFFIYTLCCFATIIFTVYYVPETTGKTLEEIQMMLKGISLETIQQKPEKNGAVNQSYEGAQQDV